MFYWEAFVHTWKSEDEFQGSSLSFDHVGAGIQLVSSSLGARAFTNWAVLAASLSFCLSVFLCLSSLPSSSFLSHLCVVCVCLCSACMKRSEDLWDSVASFNRRVLQGCWVLLSGWEAGRCLYLLSHFTIPVYTIFWDFFLHLYNFLIFQIKIEWYHFSLPFPTSNPPTSPPPLHFLKFMASFCVCLCLFLNT